ncbi:hypothetical protein D3C73_1435080 [compost metagenome]
MLCQLPAGDILGKAGHANDLAPFTDRMIGDGIIDLSILPKNEMLLRKLLSLEGPVQLMQPHQPRLF